MNQLLQNLSIQINEKIYLKNPSSSDLGNRIVSESVLMIDELGLEQFNFKKLATRLNTAESSIYRYFDNKHKLLIYHVSWFWTWMEYRLVFSTANVHDPYEKLRLALENIASPIEGFEKVAGINMHALERIIVNESSKAFLTKEVEQENKDGFFRAYKSFCHRIEEFIKQIDPSYPYANALVSTTVDGIQMQKFYAEHLPALTDFTHREEKIPQMFYRLIIQSLAS